MGAKTSSGQTILKQRGKQAAAIAQAALSDAPNLVSEGATLTLVSFGAGIPPSGDISDLSRVEEDVDAADEDETTGEHFDEAPETVLDSLKLAIAHLGGSVTDKRCPECNKRYLVRLPKDGRWMLACAGSLNQQESECEYSREEPGQGKSRP